MENKKTGIIIAVVAVILFIIVVIVFMYKPAKNIFIKPPVARQEKITGELPVLECNYKNNQEAYRNAISKVNVNLCSCIDDEKMQSLCKTVIMDTSFYNEALNRLDETLCEKIYDETQKEACYMVVKSSVDQFEKENPQRLADIYAATHNEDAIEQYIKLIGEDDKNI
jgi:hypothetical protein